MLDKAIYILFFISFMLFLPMGCGGGFSPNNKGVGSEPSGAVGKTWGFDVPANYTYNSNQAEVSGSSVGLQLVNFEVLDSTTFALGTHVGTAYSGSYLSLNPATATNELNATGSPSYSSLVAYWKFEGDFSDTSTESNNATALGDATNDTTSFKVGTESLLLDGTGDYLNVADGDSLDLDLGTNFTFSVWVKFDDLTGAQTILSKACYNGTSWEEASYLIYKLGADTIRFSFSTTGSSLNNITTTSSVKAGQWNHLLASYDGVNISLYFNGVLEATTAATGAVFDSTTNLLIGARTNAVGCAAVNQETSGNIDDIAIWKTSLDKGEASIVYNSQKQKYFGFYDSQVFDSGGAITPWPGLSWVPNLPYSKELTGDFNSDGNPDSESEYEIMVGDSGATSDNNLMNNLILLYRLNGNSAYTTAAGEVEDYSGSNYDGAAVGGNVSPVSGLFHQGRRFDGNGIRIETTGFTTNPDFTEDKTFSFWLKLDPEQIDISNTTNTILLDGDGTRTFKVGVHNQTAIAADVGKLFIELNDGATNPIVTSTKLVNDGEFHHIVAMNDGGNIRLFIDGESDGDVINSTLGSYLTPYNLVINSSIESFSGVIDEFAYWKKGLNLNVVRQLYRRGANRVKLQVKTCIDLACNCRAYDTGGSSSDCDGDTILNDLDLDDTFAATWKGASNLSDTFFSELHNNTIISSAGEGVGSVYRELPDLEFSNFSASGLSVANNQYAQFRTTLESSDNSTLCSGGPCLPEVSSYKLNSNSYFAGTVEVSNLSPLSYSQAISSIILDEVGGLNCSFTYQASHNGGATWHYYTGGVWSLATLPVHVTTSANFLVGISSFHSQVGLGDFKFKVFIRSLDSLTDCRLNEVRVNF